MDIPEISEERFTELSGNVLVEFFSPECGYCRLSEPVMRRLSEEYKDIGFYKIDAQKYGSLAASYNVSGLPTFVLLSDGRETGRSAGARGEGVLRELLDRQTV